MDLPRVWAEIDLDTIAHNVAACRAVLPPATQLLGVVKADAYGHGAGPVATTLAANGVSMLGVGDSQEAIQLREWGVQTPIMVLGAVVEREIPEIVRHGVIPTVHSPERLDAFEEFGRRWGEILPINLLIDTGMSLLGVTPGTALGVIRKIAASPHLRLAGIGTHFATPRDRAFTERQLSRFERLLAAIRRAGLELPLVHAAASQSILPFPTSHFSMVRLGGLLYGLRPLRPNPDSSESETRAALSLRSQIVHLRDVAAGTVVGYDGTFVAPRRTRLATLAVGYHDGYLHRLSNRAQVLVRGQRAPVVGRVTMDYTLIDVTDVPDTSVGDRMTLLGACGEDAITAEELAQWAGTIPYEIPSQLGPRVQRVYLRDGVEVTPAELTAHRSTAPQRDPLEARSRLSRHEAPPALDSL